MIYYFCPDQKIKSSGIRLLYRHVQLLNKNGIRAAILHTQEGFYREDLPAVPIAALCALPPFFSDDIVVIPEGFPVFMEFFKNSPLRCVVIALSWAYIYSTLSEKIDWRNYNIECVLTNSLFTKEFVSWAMALPTHYFVTGIDSTLYYRSEKSLRIVYIERKKDQCDELRKALYSHDPRNMELFTWEGLEGLNESEYAAKVRGSTLFLNLSHAEGFPLTMLEAMQAETIVAGYNGVGGQKELIGQGKKQNCILAENLDYVTLAKKMAPLLADLAKGEGKKWEFLIANGLSLSARYTLEKEEASIIAVWKEILAGFFPADRFD